MSVWICRFIPPSIYLRLHSIAPLQLCTLYYGYMYNYWYVQKKKVKKKAPRKDINSTYWLFCCCFWYCAVSANLRLKENCTQSMNDDNVSGSRKQNNSFHSSSFFLVFYSFFSFFYNFDGVLYSKKKKKKKHTYI